MQERKRLQRTRPGPDSPLDGDPGSGGVGGPVTVTHGIFAEQLPVAEMSVAQVRTRFADRLDIHPEATALVDGRPVDDSVRVQTGQVLSFIRPSGEKGGVVEQTLLWLRPGQLELALAKKSTARPASRVNPRAAAPKPPVVTIDGSEVRALTPEGTSARVRLDEFLDRVAPDLPQTGDAILPDGVKAVLRVPGGFAVVHQTPPRVYPLRWISTGSQADFGPDTLYRTVHVALPYVVVLAVFEGIGRAVPTLGGRNECFFSNQPLDAAGLDSEMCYPALLNCSRFPNQLRHPLSWVCTQHLAKSEFCGRTTVRESLQAGLAALLRHLFESGFNRSSEYHELSSWLSETVKAKVDPRLASIEAWQAATLADPLFALEVPWLPTGKTLRQVVERIGQGRSRMQRPRSSGDLARVVLQVERRMRRNA